MTLRVFLGYDSREPVAYHVAAHSILARASRPVSVTPLRQDTLRACGLYDREPDTRAATEFSLTRFLVPMLCDYRGWALFLDCDVLARTDIVEGLTAAVTADPGHAVWVAHHDYTPAQTTKMDGQVQAAYPRKNWSSVMLFDCARCQTLTPEYVNTATPANLHRFHWLRDADIGRLPLEWNWLVGEYPANPDAKLLHFTNGGPWFRDTANCDHAADWRAEYLAMTAPPLETFSATAWQAHVG